MDLRIFTEPQQGASYDDQLALAQAAERLGFSAYFRSDHFLAMNGFDGLPGPTDSWVTLGALARETSTIRLGTLVTSMTFRHPGMLAVQVAQVDQMSRGRIELGLGAGWFAEEHAAYGVPFPERRFAPLTEQFEVVTGLWGTPPGETFTYDGEHYQLTDSPGLPKPYQRDAIDPARSGVPLIVGGGGPRRTPGLAARFAAEFNAAFTDDDTIAERFARVRAVCEESGRDPATMVYSVAHTVCAGATEADVARRAAAIRREPADLRARSIAGTAGEVVDRLGALAQLGTQRVYLQVLDFADIEHLEFIAAEVAPHVR